ncbi:DUF6415 family natural product biosynthesis protein [Streptomyces sp. NPDC058424]|uniref:DUF6415 family natural product biosynthesis protein n=1 Tax=Streptomyces sp. NPDC058424 TaxID=3346491 RepID=UPI00364B5C3E
MTHLVESGSGTRPLDIATMRRTVGQLLPPGEKPEPASEALETLTALLCGHLELLIPEVHDAAVKLPADDIPRHCALACAGEGRERLKARPGLSPGGAVVYARGLARTVNALVDHYESLRGSR